MDDRADLGAGVGMCGDDEEAREEIGRNAVGCDEVVGAADSGLAAIRGEDDDGGDRGFQGAVEVGEAF